MKNKWLIALFFNSVISVFLGWEFVLFAEDSNIKDSVNQTKLNLRIDFSGINTSKPENIYSLQINHYKNELRFSYNEQNYNFGTKIDFQNITSFIPLTFKVGNLSYSGSYSIITSPKISSNISAFSNSISNDFNIQTSLPSNNSFSKQISYYGELNYNFDFDFLNQLKIDYLYNDEISIFSVNMKINNFITISSTDGIFFYNRNKSTSWINSDLFYHEDNHLCTSQIFAFSSKKFKSNFYLLTYQMPFSQTLFCYKNENQLKLKHLSILLNEFYNPNTYIITVDNKNIPGLFQIKTNISYNFLTGINKPTLLKTGITTLFNKNLIENNNDLKLCTGIQITKENFYGNINGTINFSIKQQNEYLQFFNDGYSVQTNASFYINNIKPQFGITFSSEPDSKRNYYTYSEKLSLNFLYNEKFNFSNSNSIIFKEKKNELIDTSFTSSLNVKFQSRSCTLQLHLEFQV